jgi:Sulfotransferase family
MSAGAIRIDDLGDPRLSALQQLALDYGESKAVQLEVGRIVESAVDRAGLSEVGDQGFVERLGLWCDEMNGDPERTGLGRLTFFNDAVRYVTNRLRIEDLLGRHPEIKDVGIPAPIIVVGLPRSGTTHLVNLIAADTRLRSLPLWESYEPVPGPNDEPDAAGIEPRWRRCQEQWEAMELTLPFMSAMHPMQPDHVHEELELELPDFSSYTLEWVARCPRWRDYYLAHDQLPHYRYLKSVLQILQWRRPRDRWILKSPQHLEQLGPLLQVFPDATLVFTHRDPVSVVQSAATMMTYAARMSYTKTRPDYYCEYWSERIRRLLEASVRDRPLVDESRSLDVRFDDFMDDEVGTVERVYQVAGLEMTGEARREVTGYRERHRRGAQGQVVYDLRADFDVSPAEVRAPFSFYTERFSLRNEVL